MSNDLLSQSWLIVDASNRLRVLVHSMPGLTHGPAWQAVTRAVEPAEALRNYIQHLDVDPELGEPRPLWGTMWWLMPVPKEDGGLMVMAHLYLPGPVPAGPVGPPLRGSDLLKSAFRFPVDDITLTAAGRTLDLTHLVDGIERFGRRLEATMSRTEWSGEDERTRINVALDDNTTPEPPAPSAPEPAN